MNDAYQKMIEACNTHSLEGIIPPFPAMGDEGVNTKTKEALARRRWVWNLARALKQECVDDQDAYFNTSMAKYKVGETERAELSDYFEFALQYAKFPFNAPEQVFACITHFEKHWGEIPAPRWCNRAGTPYKRMWLAVVMLGANGSVFPFACTRMSNAFGIVSPQTVSGFLLMAKNKGLIKVVRNGSSYKEISGGKAALYQIDKQKDYLMIQHIIPDHSGNARSRCNEYNRQMFWEYLAEDPDLKWLGITKD